MARWAGIRRTEPWCGFDGIGRGWRRHAERDARQLDEDLGAATAGESSCRLPNC